MSRIEFLKKQLFSEKREISIERALLYTESFKQTECEPIIIRRAKATKHILDNVTISIRKRELIVGNRTIKPRSGIISPEMDPDWIMEELDTIDSRAQDQFVFKARDKKIFKEQLYPYWSKHSMKKHILSKVSPDLKKSIDQDIIKLNQTDKGQGHIIPNYEKMLSMGIERFIEEVETYPSNSFYKSTIIVIKSLQNHILRYKKITQERLKNVFNEKRRNELIRIIKVLDKIAYSKPESFFEAVQLFWFICIALQYESNASSISIGRFDQYMYPYYKKDLERGVDIEALEEILMALWIKTNDVVLLRSQHSAKYFAGFPTGYTLAIGGVLKNGQTAENPLSYAILRTYNKVLLPQPNLSLRGHGLIRRDFLNEASDIIKKGTGVPQVFNDEVIIPSFLNRGIPIEEARNYGIVGCVELTIPGKMYGLHDIALFNMLRVFEITLLSLKNKENITYENIENELISNMQKHIALMVKGSNIVDRGHKMYAPVPFLSSLMENSLEKGKDITDGGALYNFSGVQGIGVINLADSLNALKSIVYEERRLTLDELIEVLENDFKNNEVLQSRLINKYAKFGNDDFKVDSIASKYLRIYSKEVEKYQNPRGGYFLPGAYTVSAHIPLGEKVGATPDGRHAKEQLVDGGLSPMVGRDMLGPTAVLKSVSRLDNYLLTNGSLLNIKFNPESLKGISGTNRLSNYIQTFIDLKIQHIQFNVVSIDVLKKAMESPMKYKGLIVRVAGYSAFFTELSSKIQLDIIRRTEHKL